MNQDLNFKRFKLKSMSLLYVFLQSTKTKFLSFILSTKLNKAIIRTKINLMALIKEGSLYGHEDSISCLTKLNNNLLASGSNDYSIRIWDLIISECLFTLKGHYDTVTCITTVSSNNDLIISASDDHSFIVWNIKDECVIINIKTEFNIKFILVNNGNDLLYANSLNKIVMYSLNENLMSDYQKVFQSNNYHTSVINCLIRLDNQGRIAPKLTDDYSTYSFGSCSSDSSIKIWSISINTISHKRNIVNGETILVPMYTTFKNEYSWSTLSGHFSERKLYCKIE